MVLPQAGSEEVQVLLARAVLREGVHEMPSEFGFAEGRRQIEFPSSAVVGGNLLEEFGDGGGDAYCVEHLLLKRGH